MKRPARFFSMLPELQRELYALPRWWVGMFSLLAIALHAVILQYMHSRGHTDYADIFHKNAAWVMVFGGFGGMAVGAAFGIRAVHDRDAMPLPDSPGSWRQMYGLLFAGMIHPYLLMLTLLPFAMVGCLWAWDGKTAYEVLAGFIYLESSCLLLIAFGMLMGFLVARSRSRVVSGVAAAFIAFFAVILAIDIFEVQSLYELFIPSFFQQSHLMQFSGQFALRTPIPLPLWVIAVTQQLLVLHAVLALGGQLLAVRRGWRMSRKIYLPSVGLAMAIASLLIVRSSARFDEYLYAAGWILLASPFLLTPGHAQLRERAVRLRYKSRLQRFFSPYGSAYLPMLAGMLFLAVPILLQMALYGWRIEWLTGGVVSLLLFYTWGCSLTALVEHCELYVEHRGRTLALLVGLLFVFTPVVTMGPLHDPEPIVCYLSPFAWLKIGQQNIPTFTPLFAQFGVVGLGALGLQLWTDHQRRKMEKAQRQRIEEALRSQ